MNPNCEVRDADELIATSLTWRFDQSERGWFVAEAPYGQVFMRMNNFPDENAYSVWVGPGWLEFDDLPDCWTVIHDPSGWPDTARPKLSKGDFYR